MKAAILRNIGSPLSVEQTVLPHKLEPGQVTVRLLCAGICGAQLQEIDGKKGDPRHLPHLLGHEGCGIVEQLGPGITKVKKGYKVVMHWRKGEGLESAGAIYSNGIKSGPITTFSQYSIVSENRVTKIPKEVPKYLAALLGCALSTALSIVIREVKRMDKVLVVGCGGVGLCLILSSKNIKSHNVFATDLEDKTTLVESLGGKFVTPAEIYDERQEFDVILDTSSFCHYGERLAMNGRYIVIGQTDEINMTLPNFFKGDGQTIKSTQAGGFNPHNDIPVFVDMWKNGLLDGYEKIITHTIKLDQINEGIQLMRDGKAGRVMIDME